MKKSKILIMSVLVCSLFSCGQNKDKTFGEFGYNGVYLEEYASKELTYSEFVDLVDNNGSSSKKDAKNPSVKKSVINDMLYDEKEYPALSQDIINQTLSDYASVTATTTYYVSGVEDKVVKVDTVQGTDFRDLLANNEFIPFNQLVVKNLVVYDEILKYMEVKNAEFQESDMRLISPFKNIFTYHTNKEKQPIIQIHDFAEIPSSVVGGVGCSYRQDIELIYDLDNRLSRWQASLGVYTATPSGTVKQGYILSVDFEWNEKI